MAGDSKHHVSATGFPQPASRVQGAPRSPELACPAQQPCLGSPHPGLQEGSRGNPFPKVAGRPASPWSMSAWGGWEGRGVIRGGQ